MARGRTICAAAVLALLAGCGGQDPAPAPKEPAATRAAVTTRTPTPAPPELPPSTEVEFSATDGEPVKAVFTPAGKDAPAVVLMHEIRGRTEQWDELVPYLHDAGFATLAYESRGTPVEADRVLDTIGAVRWLRTQRDVDPKRLALVGASVGASTAVLAMATKARKTVDAAVALSPPDTQDIWTLQEEGRYRAHDILFIADEREATRRRRDGQGRRAVHGPALRRTRARRPPAARARRARRTPGLARRARALSYVRRWRTHQKQNPIRSRASAVKIAVS